MYFYIVYYMQAELRHDKKCSFYNVINCYHFDMHYDGLYVSVG